MTDNVSHPAHYTGGDIEAKDALKAAMAGSELQAIRRAEACEKSIERYNRKKGIE